MLCKLTCKLIKETICIGLAFGVVGFLVSTAFMFLPNKDGKQFNLKDYHFKSQVFWSNVVAGALFHLLCECSGINAWYCSNGNACS